MLRQRPRQRRVGESASLGRKKWIKFERKSNAKKEKKRKGKERKGIKKRKTNGCGCRTCQLHESAKKAEKRRPAESSAGILSSSLFAQHYISSITRGPHIILQRDSGPGASSPSQNFDPVTSLSFFYYFYFYCLLVV